MTIQNITILGSTGSIGVQTLDVISQHSEQFSVFALSAYKNVERLAAQCLQFNPTYAVVVDEDSAKHFYEKLDAVGVNVEVLVGPEALVDIAKDASVDTVMAGIVGSAGLLPTYAAVEAGKRVLIANKEPLVMAGELFIKAAMASGASLLPVDSEHNAIFQCLPDDFVVGEKPEGVEKIILTASGGPFRDALIEDLAGVTPEQAIAHPNWEMGAKISVDSATMMNKGLEVVEAHWLFGMPIENIDVLIHPQSIVHSLVQYSDGSSLAQLGNPDMRTPIANALASPERITAGVPRLDLIKTTLEFREVDTKKYPCLDLAYQAIKAGGCAPIILNAANEIAVDAFLNNKIGYLDIPKIIERTLNNKYDRKINCIEDVIALHSGISLDRYD